MVPQKATVVDAAAAVIRLPGERYLMQLRDRGKNIWYPGCWGCFGGAIDPGEGPLDALRRELREEIELEVGEVPIISTLEFDFGPLGLGRAKRIYYLVDVGEDTFAQLRLHEGERMEVFAYRQLLQGMPVVPYDAFAIHMAGSEAARGNLPMYNPSPRKSKP